MSKSERVEVGAVVSVYRTSSGVYWLISKPAAPVAFGISDSNSPRRRSVRGKKHANYALLACLPVSAQLKTRFPVTVTKTESTFFFLVPPTQKIPKACA
jgi:hypothetical protein